MSEKRKFTPIAGTFADPKKIVCKDCIFRNKGKMDLYGEVFEYGITKSFCEMYPGPPHGNRKPLNILFQNAPCEFYKKD